MMPITPRGTRIRPDLETVGPAPHAGDRPDRVGQIRDLAHPARHAVDPHSP